MCCESFRDTFTLLVHTQHPRSTKCLFMSLAVLLPRNPTSPLLPGGHRAQGDSYWGRSPLSQPGGGQGTARPGSGAARLGSPAPPGRCHRWPGRGRTSWRSGVDLASSKLYKTTPAGQKSASCCRWYSTPKIHIFDMYDTLLQPEAICLMFLQYYWIFCQWL